MPIKTKEFPLIDVRKELQSIYPNLGRVSPYQFKEIGNRFSQIDLALISIGAYEPRWFMKDVHINPEEAVQIHLDTGAEKSLAVQWGTFRLTAEPIDDPPEKLKEALAKKKIDLAVFSLMKIGETRFVDQ